LVQVSRAAIVISIPCPELLLCTPIPAATLKGCMRDHHASLEDASTTNQQDSLVQQQNIILILLVTAALAWVAFDIYHWCPQQTSGRIKTYDIARSFAMWAVVLHHVGVEFDKSQWNDDYNHASLPQGTTAIIIQSYHLWVFTLVSGIMSKRDLTKGLGTFLAAEIEKLLLPIAILYVANVMIGYAIDFRYVNIVDWWYICPALFCWRVLCEPIYTVCARRGHGIAVLLASCVLVPVGIHTKLGAAPHQDASPWGRPIGFTPWFIMGLVIRDRQEAFLAILKDWRSFVAGCAVLGALSLSAHMHSSSLTSESSLTPYLRPIGTYGRAIWLPGRVDAWQTYLNDLSTLLGRSMCSFAILTLCAAVDERLGRLGAVLAKHGEGTMCVYLLHIHVILLLPKQKHCDSSCYATILLVSFLANWALSSSIVQYLMTPVLSPRTAITGFYKKFWHEGDGFTAQRSPAGAKRSVAACK